MVVRPKTFEQLVPNWNRLYGTHGSTHEIMVKGKPKTISIIETATCVVGEAHGWKGDYADQKNPKTFCETCFDYSVVGVDVGEEEGVRKMKTFVYDDFFNNPIYRDLFASHMNTAHSDVMQKRFGRKKVWKRRSRLFRGDRMKRRAGPSRRWRFAKRRG